jgi:hypothetical protein
MSTTVVATGGKGSNPKTTLYVGGLAENVNEEILQAAFLPFGNLKDVNIPLDHATGQHRGKVPLVQQGGGASSAGTFRARCVNTADAV